MTASREALQRFEQVLVAPWFAGEEIGLVDFAAGPELVRFEKLGRELGIDVYEGLPRVAAWSPRGRSGSRSARRFATR